MSVNICSLLSKYGNLLDFFNEIKRLNINLCVLAIQETWDVKYVELVSIPDFKFVFKNRTLARGGGVAFYIKDDIQHVTVEQFSIFNERIF
jgi:hypothetical protein